MQNSITIGVRNGRGSGLELLNLAGQQLFLPERFSHRCIVALEDAGFSLRDMFAWMRQRAPHRAQRVSIIYERRGDLEHSRKMEWLASWEPEADV